MLKLTQKEKQQLYAAGVSRGNVYNWTRLGTRPTPEMAQLIASVKNVPLTAILFPKKEEESMEE